MQLIFIRLNNVKAMLSLERDIFYNLYSGQRYEIINELDLGKINFKDGQSIFSRVAVPVISTFIVPFVSGYKTMSSLNSRLNKSVNNFFIKGFLYIPCLAISVIRTLISCVFSVLYLPAILFAKSTTTYDYESSEEGGWEEGLSSHKCLATPPAKVSPPQRGDDDTAVIQFMKSIGLSAEIDCKSLIINT